jgi:hypothetical protein
MNEPPYKDVGEPNEIEELRSAHMQASRSGLAPCLESVKDQGQSSVAVLRRTAKRLTRGRAIQRFIDSCSGATRC